MLILKIPENQINIVEMLLPSEVTRIIKNPGRVCMMLGAFLHGKPVGALAFEVVEQRAVLRSIYVKQEVRRMGVGSLLLKHSVDILQSFSQISTFSLDFAQLGELVFLKPFLEKHEFLMELYDCPSYQIILSEAVDTFLHKNYMSAGKDARVIPLKEVPQNKRSTLERKLHKLGTEFEEVLFTQEEELSFLSLGYVIQEELAAVLLVGNIRKDSMDLEFLYMDKEPGIAAISLLARFVSTLQNTFPSETVIHIPVMNQQAEKLIQHIFTSDREAINIFWHAEKYLQDKEAPKWNLKR